MAAPRSAKAAGDCERAGQRFREMGRAKKGGGMMSEWEKSQEARIEGLRAQLAERDAMIAELQAQVSNRSVTLARYKHAYQAEKNMFENCETLRQAEMATVAELRAQVATLTERLSRCACTDDYGNEAP